MSTPEFVRRIQADFDSVYRDLYSKKLILDENRIYCKQTGAKEYEFTYSTANPKEGNIIYDRNISGNTLIDLLLRRKQYCILLYDKSIIQAQYITSEECICKQRLAFYKRHNKNWDPQEIAQRDANDEDWFSDPIGNPIMIRIDYSPAEYKDVVHPASHCTLCNHDICRIPIKGIVSFSQFVSFVLFQFYQIESKSSLLYPPQHTISENEKHLVHLSWD